ncbi:MAG: DUF2993 domain-containing protein, partial [Cyanobacteria bacterium]|nr:DUF2993 domain-containing protein [Cyanobacteriota bacterium]
MEILTILLSGLFTLISPVGLVADQVAEGLIRERIIQAELIDVRIDNSPSYQLLNGRVDRVRLAGRGVYPITDFRIDTIDVETDAIDIDIAAAQRGEIILDEPLSSAAHLVLKTEDINQFLQSALIKQLLSNLQFNLPGGNGAREANRYGLSNPRVTFLAENHLQVLIDLEDRVLGETVEARVDLGLTVVDGHQLVLVEPVVTLDEQPVPRQLLTAFIDGIRDDLTLKYFERWGVTTRILQFEILPEGLDVAIFVWVDPGS